MTKDKDKAGREERLKAALRANLRRRKTQARDRNAGDPAPAEGDEDQPSDS